MKLSALLSGITSICTYGDLDIEASGIAYDSRAVQPGDVFVCIDGFKTDGHSYIEQALKAGAVALVVSKPVVSPANPTVQVADTRYALALMADTFYDSPSKKFRLIAVTGTNGKTTTTYLLKHILNTLGHKVGLIGTNQNMIGEHILPTERTTPESLELSKLFTEMALAEVDDVVMEVSSHSLALNRVAGCDFDVGIFTNLTQDHLDFHGDMANYLQAKAKLFDMVKIGAINIDDPAGAKIFEQASCENISYAIHSPATIQASNVIVNEKGVSFELISEKYHDLATCGTFTLNIPGLFSVYNALGVIAACCAMHIPAKLIRQGLANANGVPGRAQVIPTGRDFSVMIDYAHTPDGLENILKTVRGFAKGRVVTLFGCGGDRDKTKRPLMGKIAGDLSHFCIITSDNPRTEQPMAIIAQIEEGLKPTSCAYTVIENRQEAIRFALLHAQAGDVVVLAGKGHETYQQFASHTIHFDEAEIVQQLLNESI
ncbi:MAG: UDP-N-acetylmuramoyl-L-alanyl-D-glutamate--2,6-diaminopimelate ligase [Hyphomonadaceae bacterium]|nr:UDP-N-acetylmuramoyl-L-alanyl-D-glutamate--2,6-diaminopimelate ligase [Clostridia bacterium]